ncbi:LGFP repeat-containing protein [Planobispora takensis]|uniref:LGFP repeat-containing protein n=1 Tax=Planobispora takensis TaxID=1367882 RepID=A0A8J3WYF2_9ACTN|nr:hypothetical protein [Planobispora takensis]GII05888.1 hypothetical protein Pta02_78960 [Planobispora takensis]
MFVNRALPAVAAAAASLAVLAPAAQAASSASAPASLARADACDPALVAPQGSLIGKLWRSNGGPASVYGCPVTKEFGYPDKRGSWQRFRNGKIVWSPNLGEGTLVRVYQARSSGNLVFRWSGTGRDWDFFNVRWSRNGGPATQVKVTRIDPWSGAYSMAPHVRDGVGTSTNGDSHPKFVFIVQGCDRGTFSSDCGPWSIPTSITTRQ